MNRTTNLLKAAKLIEELTATAVEIFYVNGEPDDPEISDLESTIAMVAEAHGLPSEILEESRKTIAAEREATRREKNSEEAVPAAQESKEEKTEGSKIMTVIWELFESAVRLDSQEKREHVFNSAQYMADYRRLEDQFIDANHR